MSTIFSLEMIRARKGDCLLLHYGSEDKPCLALIDGGPNNVYQPHLKPCLEEIRSQRKLSDDEPLRVDLMMVSHVDDDHINGILELTGELKEALENRHVGLVEIKEIWHNTFEDVIEASPQNLTSSFGASFTASAEKDLEGKTIDVPVSDGVADEEILWNLRALASIKQGAQLRNDIGQLHLSQPKLFRLNPQFDRGLITADTGKSLSLGGLKLTIIGPMKPEIEALRVEHQKWLKDLEKNGKTPEDVLAAYVDKSVANLSSIVVLVELAGKKILLTGDARGDKILEGLEHVGLVPKGGALHVDILKMPHHGSDNNLDTDFFERVTADHYTISGNGEHGNPERSMLEMLLKARGTDSEYTIHLTYPIQEIDADRKSDWKKEQDKEKQRAAKATAAGKPAKQPRADWSPANNSLAALLEENSKFSKKFKFITHTNERYVIDLMDQLER